MTSSERRRLRAMAERYPAAREALLSLAGPRRTVKAAKKERLATVKTKRETKAQRRRRIYAAVDLRADGTCEHTNGVVECRNPGQEHDHFWGRGKAPESIENVWLLCSWHHKRKTDNDPNRATWIDSFIFHATDHGYDEQIEKCYRALALEAAQHPEARAPRAAGAQP